MPFFPSGTPPRAERPATRPRCAEPYADAPPSSTGALHVARSVLGRLLGSPAALARDDVGGVPPRPVVLRSGRFVGAMMLLCLSQELGQSRDVHAAQAPPGKPRLDLLQQPAIAVGIAERDPREVGTTFGIRSRLSSLRP